MHEYFIKRNGNSKRFYLYADAMHFSQIGHKVIDDVLVNR